MTGGTTTGATTARATRPSAPRRRARVTAARAGSHRSMVRRAVRSIPLDAAPGFALGTRTAAGDEPRLPASGLRRTPHDGATAAWVLQRRVGLLDGTRDVLTVARGSGAVAVRGDRRPGAPDVALVWV